MRLTLLVLVALFTSSCAKIAIKNERWYWDTGDNTVEGVPHTGAVYFDTLDTATGLVPKDVWDAQRFGMGCTTQETFADIKAAMEKLCKVAKDCTYVKDKRFKAFFERFDLAKRTLASPDLVRP